MRRFAPPSSLVRVVIGVAVAAGMAFATIQAQIPGRNVNMVSGTKWPEGDPFLQRQNEPSVAASTRNPLHLLGGSNDYRTVDVPGMPDGEETGDAWLGLFKSTDGGQRWTSTLLPGYPQDDSPAGQASPLRARAGVPNSGYQAGADAVVRAGTNGLLYYSGLVFDRAENGKSAVFLARFIDNNNQEAGDPIAYLGTKLVATSNGAKFLDKPWMAVDIPRSNAAMCTVTSDNILPTAQNGRRRRHGYDRHERGYEEDRNRRNNNDNNSNNRNRRSRRGRPTPPPPPPPVQRIAAGAVYVAYSSITGDAATLRSEILLTRSMDCGNTWSAPIKVSRPEDAVNQGSSLTIDPRTGAVYVGWRRFDPDLTDTNDLDAIMVARLPFGASKFDTPTRAHRFRRPERKVGRKLHRLFEHRANRFKDVPSNEAIENLDQFDLGTTGFNFRTNAYPTMATDGTGRVYIAWTQRGFTADTSPTDTSGIGGARIVVATTRDGRTFSTPQPVDDHIDPGRGHQLMPSMAFAGGKLMLVFYDLRDSKAGTHNRISSDFNTNTGLRQTIDIRSAMAAPGDTPAFAPSVKVSDYLMGFNPESGEVEELQVNPPNLPMFKQGTVPFIGDYIDVTAAPAFVTGRNGKWEYNTASGGQVPVFHAVWTDNRDVRPPRNGDWVNYTPAKMSQSQMPSNSIFDPLLPVPQCVDGAGNPGSRNQNVYSARITGGLLAGSPGNAKPLSRELQRGFVVFAQNTSAETKSFRMTILSQPPGGRASFDQFPAPPYIAAVPPPETAIEMIVPARSTASRTVYVTSSDPKAQLSVDVSELNDLRLMASPALYPSAPEKSGGLEARVVLNPDIENPDIENPDIENPDIENPDIENTEVYNPDIENPDIENPDIENPDIENPDIENPDIENPDIENPDIENVRVANPDIENPDIENPDIENPDIENPDIENPDIENPDIENGAIADITWKVSNDGNTTASFNVNLFLAQQQLPAGVKTQLILLKTYRTPVTQANKCQLGFQTRNILLANIRNPQLVPPGGDTANANDPAETNATLWLAPGEEGRIVLRVIDEDTSNNVPITKANGDVEYIDPSLVPTEDVSPLVQQQAVNSEDVEDGVIEPPVVPPPAPLATNDTVWTSPGMPVRINVLGNDAALFGSTKILSTHPAGLARNIGGGAGELVYMPTTGLIYAGSGRAVGVIDPVSNHVVGRIPTDPADGGATYGLASPKTGLVFFRMGNSGQSNASLYAFDGRPGSPTFNREFAISPTLMAAVDALGDLHTFTLDTTGKVLFYVAGNPNQQTVTALNADPANPATAGQILWGPISLPATGKAWHIVQNPVTGKLYVASLNVGVGGTGGGVYMINPAAPSVPLKITGADQATSLAVNPATNLIFAAGGFSNNYRLNTIDGATDALLGQLAVSSGGLRQNNTEDRLLVHHATGRVFLRSANQVFIFDGQKGSLGFNTLVAAHSAGPDFNNSDFVIDQATGMVAVAGNFIFSIGVIDAATDAIGWLPALKRAGGELAVDPATHRLFFADFLSAVHTYSAVTPATVTWISALEVAPETAQVLVNSATNRAYVAASGVGSTISVLSGAGAVGPVLNLSPEAGRWGFGGQLGSHFYFTNSGADVTSAQSRPGSLVQIDGATDTALTVVPTVGQPFGFGVNAAAGQLIVAGLNGLSPAGVPEAGRIRVHDAVTPATGVDADISGVPVNGPATIAFGRHVVTNPNTGNTYVMITGGSARSVLYLPPTTLPAAPVAVALDLTALPGLSLTADDRVEVIRVNPAANLIYLGLSNAITNAYRVVALDGGTHALAGSYTGGGHSRMHTPNWIAVNGAGDRVYVVNYNNDTVTMLNATLAVGTTTVLPDGPSATAFSNTLNRLYVSSVDGKAVTAIDGSSLAVLSSVKLPLQAFFLHVSESDARVYTSGGNSPDESGFMVLSDVAGQLGAPVTVASATDGAGTTTIDSDYSVTYTPGPGFTGQDTFTYTAQTAAGNSTATVTVNVIPVVASPVAFGDAYATPAGANLNVGGRGVLGNDAVTNTATALLVQGLPGLTLNTNGSFDYVPTGPGTFQFKYLAVDGANSNVTTASIVVVDPASPLVVVNTNDAGAGSLRAAINFANGSATPDTITFAIPAGPMGPPFVITPSTPLPALNGGTTIDGLSQAGSSAGALNVVVSGAAVPLDSNGLVLNGNANVVRGLVINNFAPSPTFLGGSAILLNGNNNVVEASFLGTAADGASPAGVRSYNGVKVVGNGNRIGGPSMGLRNVIAGNSQGVWLTGGTGTVIAFNHIGTNFLGSAVVPAIAGAPAHGNEFGVLVDAGTGAAIGLSGSLSNVISGNLTGVQLRGGSGTQIVANNVGVDAAGGNAIPNGDGVSAYNTVSNTTIGGFTPGHGNVISGNGAWGINLDGAAVVNTSVFNNKIGLGTSDGAVPNVAGGIRNNVASGTKIGEPGRRNVIGGNANAGFTQGGPGIVVSGSAVTAPVIKSNRIGTTPDGQTARPNRLSGIQLQGTATVGGNAVAGEGNVISGNGNLALSQGTGIELLAGSSGSVIQGNEIGRTATGTPLGNAYSGITAYGSASSLDIGGDTPVLFNNIGYNQGPGIAIYTIGAGPRPNEIEILGNRFIQNNGLGIDLDNDGVTANDTGDSDSGGANGQQNFPVLTSAVNNGPSTAVGVDLSSLAAGDTYRIRYYSSVTCDASLNGEGEDMIAVNDVTQPGASVTLGVSVPVGRYLTATATDSDGNTSEFSNCRQVTAPAAPPATITSVQPNPSAPGHGQHLYIRGTNLPGVNPSDVILNFSGGDNAAQNIWHISPTVVVARFVMGTPVGPATIRVKSPDGLIVSNSFPVTLSATPGAPILTAVAATCGGGGFLSSINSGGFIGIAAEGIDTTGVTAVFTPTSPAGPPIEVPVTSTCGGAGGNMSVLVNVPNFLSFSNVQVNVQLKTQVNGGLTSPLSAPHSMTVTTSLSLIGPAGDVTGAAYGPHFCPPGTSAVGFTVDTDENYALTAANLRCSNGSTTPQFGGAPAPDTAVACNPGDVMVGMFGTLGNPFATTAMPTSVAPRCQAPGGGSITQPAAPLPGGGTPFGPFDCPAGKRVLGVQGGSGSVVDHIYLICGTP